MNVERLKEEADIEDIIERFGIETYPKGSNIYLYCPNPAHCDTHPTNCYYKKGWNSVYCAACDQSFSAVDFLIYTQGFDFLTAINELWEIEGRPEWALTTNKERKQMSSYFKTYKKKQYSGRAFYLSAKEANLLDIKLPKKAWIPRQYSDDKLYMNAVKPKGYIVDERETDGYLYSEKTPLKISDFMDLSTYKSFVLHKCNLKLKKLKEMMIIDKEIGLIEDYSDR